MREEEGERGGIKEGNAERNQEDALFLSPDRPSVEGGEQGEMRKRGFKKARRAVNEGKKSYYLNSSATAKGGETEGRERE